jgi:hypothetical protein
MSTTDRIDVLPDRGTQMHLTSEALARSHHEQRVREGLQAQRSARLSQALRTHSSAQRAARRAREAHVRAGLVTQTR